jgi:hypothetical protein
MSNDPFIRQLSQLTPDGTGLDRDALLFAAGKASARPNRRWLAVAAALAATQLVTLGIFLLPTHAPPAPTPRQMSISAPNMKPMPASEPDPLAPNSLSIWVLSERFLEDAILPPMEPVEPMPPDEPPLRAFGPLPEYLLH